MLKKAFLLLIMLIVLSAGGLYWHLKTTYPQTPFITSVQYFALHLLEPHVKLSKQVFGFLPFWQIDTMHYIRPQDLSEINFFSLSVGSDGHIQTTSNGQTEPGWREWQRSEVKDFFTKTAIFGTDTSVTIGAIDNDLITTFLDSPSAQSNLISDITKQITERKLNAINIDFEYTGEPDAIYKDAFTGFSTKLSTELKKNAPGTKLSLSIMPLAARQHDLFDFAKLAPLYDRFIGMSYEYYGQSAAIAGPIAPINGYKEGKYFFDVSTTYEDYLKVIPKDKIIMGIPYYGWEWAVRNGQTINSRTFPNNSPNNYAAVISYARARESTDLKKNQCQWDTFAQETWCWYKDATTGVDRQAWISDNRTIQTRFDFAKKQDVQGIAIWTLGYDKQYPDLWNKIRQTFSKE